MWTFLLGCVVGYAIRAFMHRRAGNLCPQHFQPTYWDEYDGKERCMVTHQPVNYEYEQLRRQPPAAGDGE